MRHIKISLQLIILCLVNSNAFPLVKVSIITHFDKNDSIVDFLHQASEEDYENCQILLVSNNASQQQIAAIKQFQYLLHNIVCITDETKTVAALLNEAIKNSSGKFITHLRVEDYRPAALFKAQANELEKNSSVDVVYGDYYITYDKNKPTKQADKWYLSDLPEFSPHLLYRDVPGHQAMRRKSHARKIWLF